MNIRRFYYFFFISGLLIFSTCYKEQIFIPGKNAEAFNFLMTDNQEQIIYDSRGEKLTFNDNLPTLHYDGSLYNLDQFELRGESSLTFRRKGFSVNMDDNLFFYVEREDRIREFEKIKLIALVFDYTYIENLIEIELFKQVNLWTLYSFYTELRLNDNTQGIYLCIEDVQDYFMYEEDADFVLRRYYHDIVDGYHLNDRKQVEPAEYYLARFDAIYSYITQLSGKQLYDSLSHLMDMQQYFAKISVDMLLKNGDYTDEVFFYTKDVGGNQVFGVCPWDYDDLFQELPHEIGRDWAVGKLFGTRTYSSMDDILADVGEKLMFSIEDDLDYKIATDDYLYQQYLKVLEHVLGTIDNIAIENAFLYAKEILQPFYDDPAIVSQSQYDNNSTNQQLFNQNLAEKKLLLINRRKWILEKLPDHIN
jgi:hypothetical protein